MVRDMTEGKPLRLIIGFFVPLLLGNLFQQLYNMVDTIIVGQFVGTEAFAAVGAVGSLSFLILGFVRGLTSGLSIAVAQLFGAGDMKNMRRMTYNAAYVSAAVALLVTVGTMLGTEGMLRLMQTPDNIFQDSYDYISIIFAGTATMVLYNFPAGIMRALGDSRTPLYFLVMSSVLNIALDLLFTLGLGMGVKGAAWATVIAQGISGLACTICLIRHYPVLHAQEKSEWQLRPRLIGKGLRIGVPMGLQFSLTAVGSVVLQSAVNTLGSDSVAAMTACNKANQLMMNPMDTMGLTMATYNGQNIGAGRVDRIQTGMRMAFWLTTGYAIMIGLLQIFFGRYIALVFLHADETAILLKVNDFMRISGYLYPLLGYVLLYRNSLQGLGYSTLAMFAGIFELVARSAVAMLVGAYGFAAVCFANPFAWFMADLLLVPAFLLTFRKLMRQSRDGRLQPAK